MSTSVGTSVELLERAVAYTRGTLAAVTPTMLTRPTPCRQWDLDRLLDHMVDAMAAFTEASRGRVDREAHALRGVRIGGPDARIGRLKSEACALLGAWAARLEQAYDDPVPPIGVGEASLDADLLLSVGALEVAVHGWDVGQATGLATPIPEDLAARLLTVARDVVRPADRGTRFGPARPVQADAPYDHHLLGYLGRNPSDSAPWRE